MTPGILVSVLFGAAALAYVLAPLFRKDAAEAERLASAVSEAQELQSEREMVLSALKDLEDDRSTGKLGDTDYEELKAKLTAQAVGIMKRIDELEQRQPKAAGRSHRSPRPLRHPRAT